MGPRFGYLPTANDPGDYVYAGGMVSSFPGIGEDIQKSTYLSRPKAVDNKTCLNKVAASNPEKTKITQAPRVNRLRSVALGVRDLSRSLDFYTGVWGLHWKPRLS